jgi:hypothetical protein
LVGVVLIAGLTAGTSAGAQASVAEKGSVKKFCEKALEISNTIPESFDEAGLIAAARDLVKQYKKLAKAAPTGGLRKAAKTISKYYERVADSGDPNSEEANYSDKEVDAVSTLVEYNGTNCPAAGVVPTT